MHYSGARSHYFTKHLAILISLRHVIVPKKTQVDRLFLSIICLPSNFLKRIKGEQDLSDKKNSEHCKFIYSLAHGQFYRLSFREWHLNKAKLLCSQFILKFIFVRNDNNIKFLKTDFLKTLKYYEDLALFFPWSRIPLSLFTWISKVFRNFITQSKEFRNDTEFASILNICFMTT